MSYNRHTVRNETQHCHVITAPTQTTVVMRNVKWHQPPEEPLMTRRSERPSHYFRLRCDLRFLRLLPQIVPLLLTAFRHSHWVDHNGVIRRDAEKIKRMWRHEVSSRCLQDGRLLRSIALPRVERTFCPIDGVRHSDCSGCIEKKTTKIPGNESQFNSKSIFWRRSEVTSHEYFKGALIFSVCHVLAFILNDLITFDQDEWVISRRNQCLCFVFFVIRKISDSFVKLSKCRLHARWQE